MRFHDGRKSGRYANSDSFLKPPAADTPSIPDLFELGERCVNELDKAGIDMEILSCPNATQWLAGTQAIELARQANDRLALPISTVLSVYGFGWHLEAGIQILRMILAGVFKKFPNLLRFCIARFGIEHLVFATDFPYVPLADARPFVENAPISENDRNLFAHGNAEKLLHLKI